jgi:hypothetical protein
MRICVIGLDGLSLFTLLEDEAMANLRRLMDLGVYGKLEGVVPSTATKAWLCMATSCDSQVPAMQDDEHPIETPDTRIPHGHLVQEISPAVWNCVVEQGGRAILVDVPGMELCPTSGAKIEHKTLTGLTPSNVGCFPEPNAENKWKRWKEIHSLLADVGWAYFHWVDRGISKFQHARSSGAEDVCAVVNYRREVDEQLGQLLEALTDDTALLILSTVGSEEPADQSRREKESDKPGMFLLTSPNNPLGGEYQGATLFDMAPTLLDLAGYPIPQTMQGHSLVAAFVKRDAPGGGSTDAEEKLLRDRLTGLGYV